MGEGGSEEGEWRGRETGGKKGRKNKRLTVKKGSKL